MLLNKFKATHKHYKDGLYQLLGYGIHTETEESIAIYRNENLQLFARPKEMFDGYVQIVGCKPMAKRFNKLEVKFSELSEGDKFRSRGWEWFKEDIGHFDNAVTWEMFSMQGSARGYFKPDEMVRPV